MGSFLGEASIQPNNDILPSYCSCRILILGCGNRLFGDDGFGPAVAEELLSRGALPPDVCVADAGTGVRKLLFTLLLSPERPERIVIIDAVDMDRTPGEIFEIPLDSIPEKKTDDFSFHQAPSSNLAKELKDAGVDVRVIACQVCHIPASIEPGLSDAVAAAVHQLCTRLEAGDFGVTRGNPKKDPRLYSVMQDLARNPPRQ